MLNHLKEKILNKTNKYINSLNVASGAELLKKEKQHIITFSSCVDELLDGGIVLGKITEICGPPGIGKTQFWLKLCYEFTTNSSLFFSYSYSQGNLLIDKFLQSYIFFLFFWDFILRTF